jgi:hypothetical protein
MLLTVLPHTPEVEYINFVSELPARYAAEFRQVAEHNIPLSYENVMSVVAVDETNLPLRLKWLYFQFRSFLCQPSKHVKRLCKLHASRSLNFMESCCRWNFKIASHNFKYSKFVLKHDLHLEITSRYTTKQAALNSDAR